MIDYLLEENRALLEQRNGKRLVLTDDQRRRLAAKGKAVGRRDLKLVATIVKADSVLAWHRKLIEKRCSTPERRPLPASVKVMARSLLALPVPGRRCSVPRRMRGTEACAIASCSTDSRGQREASRAIGPKPEEEHGARLGRRARIRATRAQRSPSVARSLARRSLGAVGE